MGNLIKPITPSYDGDHTKTSSIMLNVRPTSEIHFAPTANLKNINSLENIYYSMDTDFSYMHEKAHLSIEWQLVFQRVG